MLAQYSFLTSTNEFIYNLENINDKFNDNNFIFSLSIQEKESFFNQIRIKNI